MALLVALKKNKRFYFAYDCEYFFGDEKYNYQDQSVHKVLNIGKNILLATSGDFNTRYALIDFDDRVKKYLRGSKFTKEFVVEMLPILHAHLDEKGCIKKNNAGYSKMECELYISKGSRCFKIDKFFNVTEIEDVDAIGSARLIAIRQFQNNPKMKANQICEHIFNRANKYTSSISNHRYIINTKDIVVEELGGK